MPVNTRQKTVLLFWCFLFFLLGANLINTSISKRTYVIIQTLKVVEDSLIQFLKRRIQTFDLFTEYTEKKTEPLRWLNALFMAIMATVTILIFVYYTRLTFPVSQTGIYSV